MLGGGWAADGGGLPHVRRQCSGATFYKWKAKFGGRELLEAKRLKVLEDENRKLKRLLAKQVLDNATLKALEVVLGLSE